MIFAFQFEAQGREHQTNTHMDTRQTDSRRFHNRSYSACLPSGVAARQLAFPITEAYRSVMASTPSTQHCNHRGSTSSRVYSHTAPDAWVQATEIEDDDLQFSGKSLRDWYEEERKRLSRVACSSAQEEAHRGRQKVRLLPESVSRFQISTPFQVDIGG